MGTHYQQNGTAKHVSRVCFLVAGGSCQIYPNVNSWVEGPACPRNNNNSELRGQSVAEHYEIKQCCCRSNIRPRNVFGEIRGGVVGECTTVSVHLLR